MKKNLLKSALLALMVLIGGSAWADETDLNPVGIFSWTNSPAITYDATAESWAINQGGISGGKIGKYTGPYAIVKFDASTILENKTLTSAKLDFDVTAGAYNSSINIAQLSDASFDPATVTTETFDASATQFQSGDWSTKNQTIHFSYEVKDRVAASNEIAFAIYTNTAREQTLKNVKLVLQYSAGEISKYNYSLKAVTDADVEIKTLAEGEEFETNSTTVFFPYMFYNENKLYATTQTPFNVEFNKDYTSAKVTYAEADSNIMKYMEGEDINSGSSTNAAYSNGKAGYVGGNKTQALTTLPAGNYTVTIYLAGNGNRSIVIRNTENEDNKTNTIVSLPINKNSAAGIYTSEEFVINKETAIGFSGYTTDNGGVNQSADIDYIFVTKTGDYVITPAYGTIWENGETTIDENENTNAEIAAAYFNNFAKANDTIRATVVVAAPARTAGSARIIATGNLSVFAGLSPIYEAANIPVGESKLDIALDNEDLAAIAEAGSLKFVYSNLTLKKVELVEGAKDPAVVEALASLQTDITNAEALLANEANTEGRTEFQAAIDAAKAAYAANNATVESVNAAKTALKEAQEAFVKVNKIAANTALVAGASLENPVAAPFVVNGTFDENTNGWTSTGEFQNKGTATNQAGAFKGKFWENWNPDPKVNKMYQIAECIPNGIYKLNIAAFVNTLANPNESQYVYANNDKEFLTTGEPTMYEVYTKVENNTMEFGLEQTTATANWMGIDNISLTYYGTECTIEQVKTAAIYAEMLALREQLKNIKNEVEIQVIKDSIDNVLNSNENPEGAEAINATIASLKAALEVAQAYVKAKNVLPKMQQLTVETNFYTEEALNQYYTQWATKYQSGTLTKDEADALQDPNIVAGHHSANTVDDLLMSVWDETPENWESYHVNNWSTEGGTDGSNFVVPFIEYWTGDANSLGEKALTATMTGLEEGHYQVGIRVRVRVKNAAQAPATGITMNVNDEKAVDVCAGTQVGETQFYLGEFTAEGDVYEEGVLKLNINVAADNNISWLAFKDAKYTRVGETVGIAGVKSENKLDGTVYNLNGQKVDKAQKGLYIINGKKVVVK